MRLYSPFRINLKTFLMFFIVPSVTVGYVSTYPQNQVCLCGSSHDLLLFRIFKEISGQRGDILFLITMSLIAKCTGGTQRRKRPSATRNRSGWWWWCTYSNVRRAAAAAVSAKESVSRRGSRRCGTREITTDIDPIGASKR